MDDTTGGYLEQVGNEPVWKSKDLIPKLQLKFGVNYENDPAYQAIVKLIEEAKKHEEKIKSNVKELEDIKADTKNFIDAVKEDTADFKKETKSEIEFWKYFIIGALIVIGLGFIINLFDIYNYRVTYFQKYGDQVENIVKQNIDMGNKIENIKELESIIQKQQSILNCLKDKEYFSIKCFQ